jgi:transposase-like protein
MAVFTGGAIGALIVLKCPHCRDKQARARKPGGSSVKYRCRKCHKSFSRGEGEHELKARAKQH